jgi:hypothetical protein
MNARTSVAAVTMAAALATGGCLLALPASASSASHTLKFTVVTKSQTSLGKHGGVSYDKDINAANKVIGNDLVTFEGTNAGDVALGLNGGFIYAHLVFAKSGSLTGKITGGSGKYAGAGGSVAGSATSKTKTQVTLTYHL